MRASSFRYLIKNGVRNLWMNRMMTVASVGTLVACLIIVGFATLFSINVDSVVQFIGRQNEVVVFMKMDTPPEYMNQMRENLAEIEGLGEITYVSPEEGYAQYKASLGEDGYLLDGMDDEASSILPAKFTAKIVMPERVDTIVAAVRRIEYVDKADAPTDLAKTLVDVRKMVNLFGGAVIAALVLVSVVVITNTIRASVFSRRKEISIMKYVGATNTFIRIPFIVEGILLGLVAALIAFFAIWGGYSLLLRALSFESSAWLASITQYFVPFDRICYPILGGFLLAGILTGSIGSGFSMRKHLKV